MFLRGMVEEKVGDALEVGVVGEEGVAVLQGEGGQEEVREGDGNALSAESSCEVSGVGPSGTSDLQVREALEGCVYALSVSVRMCTGQ